MMDPQAGLPSLLPLRSRINWTCDRSPPCHPVPHSFRYSPAVQKAIDSVISIANHIKKKDDEVRVDFVVV